MVERGRGTILFTGSSASLTGIAGCTELCCGKFALRALSQCLAREFQPYGVHVAHVIIEGVIGLPRYRPCLRIVEEQQQQIIAHEGDGSMDPDGLAKIYWQLHTQERTAWTQEIDLRPANSRLW
ncbi:estradiol 17-beta-dehydrogenase 1-like [Impatiens glandulifera]|uniref:estradiol 17-beta-dehydrogenase 1-like n=1 Tax=Impatiens glandulifera TaxID=253017 RepID=UPI001FB18760|nr:estradiol 17-beta-dehydrogenase 1-like [Impatiens glandulifera]